MDWILILLISAREGFSPTISSQAIPWFKTQQACVLAGKEVQKDSKFRVEASCVPAGSKPLSKEDK